MANEDKKDFNAMLNNSKDMPKIQIITDEKSIEKYGGSRMYFAPPIDYDRVMKQIPYGKVITHHSISYLSCIFLSRLNTSCFTASGSKTSAAAPKEKITPYTHSSMRYST